MMGPIFPRTPTSGMEGTPQTSKKTLWDTLANKVSTIWKRVTEWQVMPKNFRAFSVQLHEKWKEISKRIGYALQGLWPDLFKESVPSAASKHGKDSILYVLKRSVDDQQESLVQVGDFMIGKQVKKDIPRFYWPLSYQKNGDSKNCKDSQDMTEIDTKSERILNWLQAQLVSEPKIPNDHNARAQAMTNLTSILFHQSTCVDGIKNLMDKFNALHLPTEHVSFNNAEDFFSDASILSKDNGLQIKLTWNFKATFINNPEGLSPGTQKLTRTIWIPWEELVTDWAKNPPKKPKLTVEDEVHPFIEPPSNF